MTPIHPRRVLVAMSGGIDSTVAAISLKQQGYEVIGITMKTWDYASSGVDGKETGCCSLDSINDARSMAVEQGFPHYIIDIREEFGDHVIDNFVEEYMAGRTPNPCVLCNTHIKWRALLKRADKLGCRFIATGHYAQIRHTPEGRPVLAKGIDSTKDQSYVLWGLESDILSRTLFPVGGYRKTEIRQMASDWGYHELSKKAESFEICFVPDNDYRAFLRSRVPMLDQELNGGLFVDVDGKILGHHRGYPFYTVGQRKGLEIALGHPAYVVEIRPDSNTVVLGVEEDLRRTTMWVHGVNLLKYDSLPSSGIEAHVKIRYKDEGAPAILYPEDGLGKVRVEFRHTVKAIAPGQSAVFYDGTDNAEVIGGGWIERASV